MSATTKTIYDVIIIGGGPAGSSCATYLSRSGLSVLVLEKEKFPRDHVGESLIPACYKTLKELNVLDDITKFATYKPGVNFVDNEGERQSVWCFSNVVDDESAISFHSLRAPFDNALLLNAEKHGALVWQEHRVKQVDLNGEYAVVTVEHQLQELTLEARFLIDASGQDSFLAKKLQVKKNHAGLDRVAFFCHWIHTDYDAALNEGLIKIIYLGGEKMGWLWVIPVGKNHLSIGVSLNNTYVKTRKKELQANGSADWMKDLYLHEVHETKSLQPILKNAKLEHDILTIGDYSYYAEKKYGKNFAMIGDSGAFLDPIFSSGIFVAFESAKMVSTTLINYLGKQELQQELEKTYQNINGAYELIEKFIRLFYQPHVLNFAHLGSFDEPIEFDDAQRAYTIFHFLLAGDFFSNHRVYSDFIDDLQKERNYARFLDLVKARKKNTIDSCGHTFESIYGHLD